MVNTFWKKCKFGENLTARTAVFLAAGLLMSTAASAQAAGITAGLCYIAGQYKLAIAAVALIAVFMAVINGMFGKNAMIATLAESVLIGCGIAVIASAMIAATGLTGGCV